MHKTEDTGLPSGSSQRKKQQNKIRAPQSRVSSMNVYILLCALLFIGVFFLHAGSYHFPLFFDDRIINPIDLPQMAKSCIHLDKRCLAGTTLGLTYFAAGLDLFWFRFGNVFFHALTALACFFFLNRLFEAVRRSSTDGETNDDLARKDRLIAFCGAALFAFHPVAIYAVGYLIQRSIVMATLFSLLSLTAFVRAISDSNRRCLWVAAALYIAALFSKEHAIMLPGVAVVIFILLGKSNFLSRFEKAALALIILGASALVTLKTLYAIGSSYEYFTRELHALYEARGASYDPLQSYLGSVITQTCLFFKYLFLWLFPCPVWMSIDIRTPIAAGAFQWPFILGVPAFIGYGATAVWLILKRGTTGLLGLGMLFPWLLFFTEFVTMRIQEPFVLYRSYLWMAGFPAILPFFIRRFQARYIITAVMIILVLFIATARERLSTFQSNLALWNDVVEKNTDLSLNFVDRGYSNRAVALMREGRHEEALRDLDVSIKLNPQSSHAYLNRGTILSRKDANTEALADIDRAIQLDPEFADAHAERCALLFKLEQLDEALASCERSLQIMPEITMSLLNRAILYAQRQRFQEALTDLNKILFHDPKNALALYNRGMVYHNTGRESESITDMRESCRNGFGRACDHFRPAVPPR